MAWDHTFDEVDVVAKACPAQNVINNAEITAKELAKDDGNGDDRGDIWDEQNCSKEGLSAKAGIAQDIC